jgi:sugar O-acyltransferase (sialic acid O-acetyltransferase NeuD family)
LSTSRKIIIIGAGGHATSVANVAESAGYDVIAFVDKNKTGDTLLGRPVVNECAAVGGWQDLFLAIAIGDNFTRQSVYQELHLRYSPLRFPVLAHRSAAISKYAKIDFGTVVMPGALVGPNSLVGKFCLLNTRASIDHDTTMQDFSSLAPGAITGGRVSIGLRSNVAIGASVINGISIGNDTIVGASSLLNSNLPNNVVAYGNPAKIIRQRKSDTPYLK